MAGEGRREKLGLQYRWMGAYALAELFGIGVAATLYAALRQGFGVPFSSGERAAVLSAMAVAGLIEGAALGGFGWYVLRERFPRVRVGEWIAVTVAAAVIGWVAGMTGPVLSEGAEQGAGPGLFVTFLIGALVGVIAGALFGAAQWLVLRHHAQQAGRWIAANAIGWAPALGVIFVAASLPRAGWSIGAIGVTGAVGGLLGGAIAGAVTGWALGRLRPWVDEARSLRGKVALVTSADAGVGFEVVLGLARRDATVVMMCRDEASAAHALARVLRATPDADVHLIRCDPTSLTSVLHGALDFRDQWNRLDVLITDGSRTFPDRTVTEDGIEATLAAGAMGPFLLTTLLRDRLERSGGRVVNLTGTHLRDDRINLHDLRFEERPYDAREAHSQAELARLLLTVELARREPNVTAIAVRTGPVMTEAHRDAPRWSRALIHTVLRPSYVRPEVGALPVLRLATEPLDGDVSGHLFDRFELAADAPDRRLADAVWRACEEAALRFLLAREGPAMTEQEERSRLA